MYLFVKHFYRKIHIQYNFNEISMAFTEADKNTHGIINLTYCGIIRFTHHEPLLSDLLELCFCSASLIASINSTRAKRSCARKLARPLDKTTTGSGVLRLVQSTGTEVNFLSWL